MIEFSSVVHVNSVYWISSLKDNEKGTTRRVIDDLDPFFKKTEVIFQFYEPTTAIEFMRILDQIALDAQQNGARPIIHIDTHGSKDGGILIAATNESISWEKLYDPLRKINIITENNLCIVSAACYSIRLIHSLSILDECPFYLLIAPKDEVTFGFIEGKTTEFYKDIFANLNILGAYDRHLKYDGAKHGLSVFHCEKMLAIVLARYFKFACIGKGGQDRRENLLTQAFAAGIPNNRQSRRLLRSKIKAVIRPNPEIVQRYARKFLIGRNVPFSFIDLMKLIRNFR